MSFFAQDYRHYSIFRNGTFYVSISANILRAHILSYTQRTILMSILIVTMIMYNKHLQLI